MKDAPMTDDEREALEQYTDALVEGTAGARQRAEHIVPRLRGLWPIVKSYDEDRAAMFDLAKLLDNAEPRADQATVERDAGKLEDQAAKKEKQARNLQGEADRLRAEANAKRHKQTHAQNSRDAFQSMSSGRLAASIAARKYMGEAVAGPAP